MTGRLPALAAAVVAGLPAATLALSGRPRWWVRPLGVPRAWRAAEARR